ncbi:uncharacterized protein [Palaemon carinicauda]|uniref:uncharacterized protein n=1 Tax=Palaemon carinicauda TaxID=392227 RepID=UPI0035B66902
MFADDTQLYMSLCNVRYTEGKLDEIMRDVKSWTEAKLKLNEDKSECLLIGKRNDLRRLATTTLQMHGTTTVVKDVVRDLRVLTDCHLSFHDQITNEVRATGYHLKDITFIKKYLDEKTTKMLVQNYVISKVDYCNSLYYGLPNYLLKKTLKCHEQSCQINQRFTSTRKDYTSVN